jgi:hypothetical protein
LLVLILINLPCLIIPMRHFLPALALESICSHWPEKPHSSDLACCETNKMVAMKRSNFAAQRTHISTGFRSESRRYLLHFSFYKWLCLFGGATACKC